MSRPALARNFVAAAQTVAHRPGLDAYLDLLKHLEVLMTEDCNMPVKLDITFPGEKSGNESQGNG